MRTMATSIGGACGRVPVLMRRFGSTGPGVQSDVTFASVDALTRVVSSGGPGYGVRAVHRLGVHARGGGLGVAALVDTHQIAQRVMDGLPHVSTLAPGVAPVVDGGRRRESDPAVAARPHTLCHESERNQPSDVSGDRAHVEHKRPQWK